MKSKEMFLTGKAERRLLGDAANAKEAIDLNFPKKLRLRGLYRIYFLTVAVIIFMGGLLLAELKFGLFEPSDRPISDENEFPPSIQGVLLPDYSATGDADSNTNTETQKPSLIPTPNKDTLYKFDYHSVPDGEIPIIPMDLALTEYGAAYINNDTGLSPDIYELLERDLHQDEEFEYLSSSKQLPQVLILHTHGTEGYSADGAISCTEAQLDQLHSDDTSKNVVAIGKIIAEYLNNKGISTVHCTVLHDQDQYRASYSRAEETIRWYLKQYPSIKLVIDVHRDGIMKSSGELVRPVTWTDEGVAAQTLCVVGSNWGGETHDKWERNLSLALQLREKLNVQYDDLCRPVYLRSSTYNQEIAPYSLLLEIGSSGNSFEEAKRSAALVADALSKIICKI